MRIENNTIIFKSLPVFFHKERNGLKSNTERTIQKTSEFKDFVDFMREFNSNHDKKIMIVNAINNESFVRKLTDISEFEGHWIFSWEHEK